MDSSKKSSGSIIDFKVKFSEKYSTPRSLFVKEHKTRKKNKNDTDSEPTILLLNVPPFCDDNCLRRLFCSCGKITKIHRQKNPGKIETFKDTTEFFPSPPVKGYHVVYMTFRLEESIQKVLEMIKSQTEPVCLSTCNKEVATGVKKMCLDYLASLPDCKKLQAEIDEYMEAYDAKAAEEEKKSLETEGVPDEEGWIKVTRSGRNPGFSRTEGNEMRLREKLKRKREKEKESIKIYAYKIRESKMEHLAELRRKFEEDKEKIRKMKAARKFKPFA